jgi:U3 small nucleolar RNA-associated protein 20
MQVARKVVLEEIYDVMELVSDLMVRSDVPSIRQLCGQILVSFLLNYPLVRDLPRCR